jgi:uncharacterized cupredoxin-like copper-binding protein
MKRTRPILIAAVLVLALVGAATAVVIAHASSKNATIKVTEKEFYFTLSTRKPHAGLTQLQITNEGNFIHAFAISGPGVNQKVIGIESGKSVVLHVTLRSGGRYLIWCPMPGHSTKGLRTSFTVPGAVDASA